MSTKSFHKTNLGSFGANLPCDLSGYVHLTQKAWMAAPMDWAGDDDRGYRLQRCKEMAAEAREAVASSEKALGEWRKTA